MLHLLPAEISLQVVSYLPIQSVHKIIQVSHAWHDLIAVNENTVYRNAAILHCLVHENDCGDLASQAPRSGTNWKSFCRREFQIERGWRGKAPPSVKELSASGTSVHRIKVDEDLGLVITTSQRGGLLVTDLKGNGPLWGLPPSHVVEYAHCEYDHGYIVFNRQDNCKEVWRRVLDAPNEDHCSLSPPDSDMLAAWTDGIPRWHASTHHGHFKPWALLRMPEHTRAFRLSHLTLLASAVENAYLWDVSQGCLIETIGGIQRRHHHQTLGHIHYVEVNDKYAFICGSNQLRIFERGGGALVYDLSARNLLRKVWNVEEHLTFGSSVVKRQRLEEKDLNPTADDQFMAVHVSGNGKDIAALTIFGALIIIPGFQRLISGEALLSDIAVQLRFPPTGGHPQDTAIYLALSEKDGKVAVVTHKGVFLVSPEIEFSSLTTERPPRPGVVVSRLTKFEDNRLLSFVSCLQITRTSIYFNWKPSRQDAQPDGGGGNNGFPMLFGGLIGHPPMNLPPPGVQPQMGTPGNNDNNDPHPSSYAAAMPNDHDNEDEVDADEIGGFLGHPGDLPHLEPASFDPGEYDEEGQDEEEDEQEEEEQEDHEDFDADFMDEFFDQDGDPFEHPMHDHGNPVMVHMGVGDPAGGMHLLINEWFISMDMSTVYRVSF